jgi:hypothetical protein
VLQAVRNRVIGPERHLGAVRRLGVKQPAAQVLARQFDEDFGVMQDRRLDEAVTGV